VLHTYQTSSFYICTSTQSHNSRAACPPRHQQDEKAPVRQIKARRAKQLRIGGKA
jgi:hypothetical protein